MQLPIFRSATSRTALGALLSAKYGISNVVLILAVVVGCGGATKFGGDMPVKAADLKSANLERVERKIPASDILNGDLVLSPEHHTGTQSVTMRYDIRDESKRMLQITRPTVNKLFKQGNPGTSRSESFNQSELGIVDIQIVVDNSGSMAEEQANLATKLSPLLQYLSARDWRININSTDPAWGCSNTLIKKGDANIASTFEIGVKNLGTNGSGIERGILQAVNGLSCSTTNWVRSNSTVAVLILSDEENCSASAPLDSCNGQAYKSESYLLNHLTNTMGRKLGENARVYGIIHVPGTTCTTALSEGGVYQAAVNATNGKSGSICDTDYTTTLSSISQDIALVLNQDFNLTDTPDPGSLVIKVNGTAITTGFKLTGKSVKLNVPPPLGSVIQADYTVGKTTPIVSSFALGETPADGTVKAWINGALAGAGTFAIDSTTNEIVFASAPPISADVKVEFKRNMSLLTKFSVSASIIPDTLALKVNNAAVTNFTLAASGEITFATPPAESATIDASYKVKVAPIYVYPVSVDAKTLKSVSISDLDTGKEVSAKLSGSAVLVAKEEFADGRKIKLDYHFLGSGELETDLPQAPLPDSLKISATETECERSLAITKLRLDCDDLPSGQKVDVNWQYRSTIRNEFSLETVKFPDFGYWVVKINDVPTSDYVRVGNKVTLNKMPDELAVITLIYVPKET